MAKQYHFVVMFDEDTESFTIDWDTADAKFRELLVFNKDTDDWETAGANDEDTSNYDKLDELDSLLNAELIKMNVLRLAQK